MAAGRGNRLLPLTKELPKCLLEVSGTPILVHQIQTLAQAGVRRIQIVTGHGDPLVREACGQLDCAELSFAVNVDFDTTNSLFSLGCSTLEPGEAGLLLLNSDVIFHPELIRRLLGDPRDQVLLSDFSADLGEEEMKICIDADYRVTAISKTIDPMEAQAENLGVLKVGCEAAQVMLRLAREPEFACQILKDGQQLRWVPDSIHALRNEFDFHALPTGELPWIEIDFQHDLKRARDVIWPLIAPSHVCE